MSEQQAHFQRAIDKYADLDPCKLTMAERQEFYEALAARGAYSVLVHLGLNDEEKVVDLKALLQSMRSYRAASKIIRDAGWKQIKVIFQIVFYTIGIGVTIFFLKMLLPTAEADRIISYIPHGG